MAMFAWPSVLSDHPPMLWWLSAGEGWMPLHDAVWINCKKGYNYRKSRGRCQVYGLRGVCLMIVCVCVCYLTWHDYPSLVGGESRGILLLFIILLLLLLL